MIEQFDIFTRPSFVRLLVGLFIYSSSAFAQNFEYTLLLNTTDCMNCSEMFKQLDDSIFTKYWLKYTVITQHARKVDGEKLVNQYFRLNQNNILNIINSPKLFTKLNGTSTYSNLL